MLYAHRVAWERENGPVPEGMCVLHHCDNRACVNVEHLFLGTKQDNTQDMLQKDRWSPPMRKLKACEVEEIRRLRGLGVKVKLLAQMFRVCTSNIYQITTGRRWAKAW